MSYQFLLLIASKGSNPFFLLELVENFLAIKKNCMQWHVLEVEVPGILFIVRFSRRWHLVCVFCCMTCRSCRREMKRGRCLRRWKRWPGQVLCARTAWWDRTLVFLWGEGTLLCVLFSGKAQTDGSDRGQLRKPGIISRCRTSWILTPIDSKWSFWIVLVVPLSFPSPSFFWWRLEKILKWPLSFVHLWGWRGKQTINECNWKSS